MSASQDKMVGFSSSLVLRVKKDWQAIAKEELTVECISGTMYAYCSELAALRLGVYYAHALVDRSAKVEFSKNLDTWYFRLEPKY